VAIRTADSGMRQRLYCLVLTLGYRRGMSRGIVAASRSSSTGRVLAPALVLAAVLVAVLLGQSATSVVQLTQSPAGATSLSPTGAELGLVPAAPRVALAKPDGEGPNESAVPWLALVAAGALFGPCFARRLIRLSAARVHLQLADRCAAARAPPVAPIS
jgi:hypothetical protein